MSVKVLKDDPEEMTLQIEGQELKDLRATLERYNLKDIRSFMDFSTSILLGAENKEIWIPMPPNRFCQVGPADEHLKEG